MSFKNKYPPGQFGRVAVVCGGNSSEREVSLKSGRLVHEALVQYGIDATLIDGISSLVDGVRAGHFARVFNALHGGEGESGVLQGFLEACKVPCTGPNLLGCAISFDKLQTKKNWVADGVCTPLYVSVEQDVEASDLPESLTYPLVVKPSKEGSSFGVSIVNSFDELRKGVQSAATFGPVLVEKYIDGEEISVTIVGTKALPSVAVGASGEFYDYSSKYVSDQTRYRVPALDGGAEEVVKQFAIRAFRSAGCSAWGRVDLFRDKEGRLWAIEVNSSPGMTSHSLPPKSASAIGWSYADLVVEILALTLN